MTKNQKVKGQVKKSVNMTENNEIHEEIQTIEEVQPTEPQTEVPVVAEEVVDGNLGETLAETPEVVPDVVPEPVPVPEPVEVPEPVQIEITEPLDVVAMEVFEGEILITRVTKDTDGEDFVKKARDFATRKGYTVNPVV